MKLKQILETILYEESEAAKKAHKLGLEYSGFGKWKDKSGKTTHKTEKGKLVKVGAVKKKVIAKKKKEEPKKKADRKGLQHYRNLTLNDIVKYAKIAIFPNDRDYKKTFEAFKNAPIKQVPYNYFLKDKNFEPFTKADLKYDPRARKIAKGYKDKKIPPILATIDEKGNFEVEDGFTRSAVAIALHMPIFAKVVDMRKIKGTL